MPRVWYTFFALMLTASELHAGSSLGLASNRRLEVLKGYPGGERNRSLLHQAGQLLGDLTLQLVYADLNGDFLQQLSKKQPGESFVRVVREATGLPLDVDDFIYFLDDVLRAKRSGLHAKSVWLNPDKARKVGVLLYPGDVFQPKQPRRYGDSKIEIDTESTRRNPSSQLSKPKAGPTTSFANLSNSIGLLGPHWSQYYTEPMNEGVMLGELARVQNSPTFATRIASLIKQLRRQGAVVRLLRTAPDKRRGFLMRGAYLLSQTASREELIQVVRKLKKMQKNFKMDIPIRWHHPAGWKETKRLANEMLNASDADFAASDNAHRTSHYNGEAVDLSAITLPRKLHLTGSDGETTVFDLSQPHQSRDLNLTPELIAWIEVHFGLSKHRLDYPHWQDNALPLVPVQPEKKDRTRTASAKHALFRPAPWWTPIKDTLIRSLITP